MLYTAKQALETYYNIINKETQNRINKLLESEDNNIALQIFTEEVKYHALNKERYFFIDINSELGFLFQNTNIIELIGLMDYKISTIRKMLTDENEGWTISF